MQQDNTNTIMLGQAKFGSKSFKDCLKFFDMLEIWSQELLGVAAGLSLRNG